jgi:hypothetical protein
MLFLQNFLCLTFMYFSASTFYNERHHETSGTRRNKTGNLLINVTLRRVLESFVAVENKYFIFLCFSARGSPCVHLLWRVGMYMCLRACSLTYPAYNVHMLYCHLWPIWLHHVFRHCLLNGIVLWRNATEHETFVLIFSTNFIWNISHSKKNLARHFHKGENVFM